VTTLFLVSIVRIGLMFPLVIAAGQIMADPDIVVEAWRYADDPGAGEGAVSSSLAGFSGSARDSPEPAAESVAIVRTRDTPDGRPSYLRMWTPPRRPPRDARRVYAFATLRATISPLDVFRRSA
jgi:hypothetical protein